MRIALFQMCSGIDPSANLAALREAISEAAQNGAEVVFTPEMSGLLDRDRSRAVANIHFEGDDPVLKGVCEAAAAQGIWVSLGSIAVKSESGERYNNRSFLIDPTGRIVARYDKIHLFDVDLATGESWRESAAYAPGNRAVVASGPGETAIGLSICYDLRFPALCASLSEAGANILTVPAAFTVPTGQAHWHVLLRARAIENACWVVAAAQSGQHEDGRITFGHSLVINPWGEIVLDMAEGAGVGFADIDLQSVMDARARIPVIAHRRSIPVAELLS